MKFKKLLFFCFSAILFSVNGIAQGDIPITGIVNDDTGLPIPGATIAVKGGTATAISDIDGNYSITAPPQGALLFSYVGYDTQEEAINGRSKIDVKLTSGTENLNEVVVVGYGTQKKSVVTGSISSIRARDLENQPITRIEQSLQGRAAGVFVSANAGQPGSSSTIRIRGITTLNNNNPLWVVDGVVIDNGGIGYLNQSDIESIEVLKDGASAAIYGTRGATGVILVTTKKGKSGKIAVNYNGYTGFSAPARKLDLLNATQYATLRNEAYAAGYNPANPFALPYPNAAMLGQGTDWQDLIFNDSAERQAHDLSVSGGTDKSNFYMSFGILEQDGIVSTDISKYSRKNFTINSNHKISDYISVGESFSYSNQKSSGIGNVNNEFGGPLASAINLDPTTPAVVTDISAQPNDNVYITNSALLVRDQNGNPYGISDAVGQELTNPLAYAQTRLGNYGWSDDFIGNAYVEIQPLKGLKFRTVAGGKLSYFGAENFTPRFFLNANNINTRNSINRSTNRQLNWNVENTLSYTRLIGKHNFTALIGQSYYVDGKARGQSTTYFNLPVNNYQDASWGFDIPAVDRETSAYQNYSHNVISYFARVNYDYDEKYLFTGIVRRDGSTRFGANNKFGTFPSVSLGWVVTKEGFWKQNSVLNTFKIRAGYGVTGNDQTNGQELLYLSLIGGGNNYTIGNGGNVTVGNSPTRPSNPDLKWEETTQKTLGFDATLFRNLNLTFEVYEKKTVGILRSQPLPGYVGATQAPFANVADLENKGLEVELSYRKKIGDFNLSLSGNVGFVKNKVLNIGQDADFRDEATVQSTAYAISRSEVGHSFGEFYGFQTNGIFQNQAEIDSYTNSSGIVIQPDAQPGDFKYLDLDDNGIINDQDRKYLGNPLPDCTFGFTVNLEYKNFDFLLFAQGAAGNQIYQGLRRLDVANANWQTEALNRWTGEGTSNTYPRLTTNDTNRNFSNPSDFYIEDGDYLRFKQVQLGYSLPKDVVGNAGFNKVRIYFSAENLLTFTKYSGFDPEIGGDVMGIDRGYYPQARSLMLGINLQF